MGEKRKIKKLSDELISRIQSLQRSKVPDKDIAKRLNLSISSISKYSIYKIEDHYRICKDPRCKKKFLVTTGSKLFCSMKCRMDYWNRNRHTQKRDSEYIKIRKNRPKTIEKYNKLLKEYWIKNY
jgi:hypothetical protein